MNFSLAPHLKEKLKELYSTKKNKKVIFNLEKLEFIGSSGIKPFITALQSFYRQRPRYCGLKPEYQRLFKAFKGKNPLRIFSDERQAIRSYRIKRTARA